MSGGIRINQYFQSNKRRDSNAIKGGRQGINIHTPKIRMQNSTDDQIILQNLQNHPLQLRQSPSIRLKNTKFSFYQDETQIQTNISKTYAKKTRITFLESYYNIGTDEDISPFKNIQQTKLQPINLTPKSQTSYFPKQSALHKEECIEEAHFYLVSMQQKYKSWLENFEKTNQSK